MPMPTLDSFAQRIYDGLEPMQFGEADADYALAKYVAALGTMFQVVEDYSRDQLVGGDFAPGWSQLLDINRAPTAALAWMAQFIGVPLTAGLSDAQWRAQIAAVGGWNRGTPATIAAAAALYLTGTKTVIFRERDAIACPSQPAYGLTVITKFSETPVEDWPATNLVPNGGFEVDATLYGGSAWNTLVQSALHAKYGTKSGRMAPINLVTNNDFETDLSGWIPFGGSTLTRDTTEHLIGTASMKVVTTVGVNDGARYADVAVGANTPYQFTAWVKGTPGATVRLQTWENTAAHAFIRTGGTSTVLLTGAWQKITLNVASSDPTCAFVTPLILNDAGSIITYYVDDVRLSQGFGYFVSPVGDLGAMRMGMVAGGTYTFSAWVYVPSTSGISLGDVSLLIYEHNPTSGYVGTSSAPPTAFDTWQRLTVTRTLTAGADEAFCRVLVNETNNYAELFADGVQLETGSTPTPYIDTNGATASRLAGQGKVGAAIRAQKPAGIVLNYEVLEGQDFENLYLTSPDFQDVYTKYTTFQGVLDDDPGH